MTARPGRGPERALVVLTVLALVVEGLLALVFPGSVAGPAGEAVALVWLALVARRLLAAVRPPRPPSRTGDPGDEPDVAPQLARLRRAVHGGTRVAGDFHLLLRPVLRSVAAGRLRRRGVELDRDPAAARAMLGDDGYALVAPDRPAPEDRFGPAPPPATIEALLDRLEAP
jgi:hypothetical protein